MKIHYEYKLVTGNQSKPIEVEEKVNELSKEGWLLQSLTMSNYNRNNLVAIMYREVQE